jgi:hypothetical protein
LALDVGTKELRQQRSACTQDAARNRPHARSNGSTSHRTQLGTTGHRSKLCTLPSDRPGDLRQQLACGRQQPPLFVGFAQCSKGRAFTGFSSYLLTALNTGPG